MVPLVDELHRGARETERFVVGVGEDSEDAAHLVDPIRVIVARR
jgi:hypothetical protein